MKKSTANRRGFINKLGKSIAVGASVGLIAPAKILASSENISAKLFATWLHGNDGKMEGVFHNGKDAKGLGSKFADKIRKAATAGFARSSQMAGMPGHTIKLPGSAAATMLPTSGGAQFTIWDRGTKSKAKNGSFWVHYAIPTPLIVNGVRAKAAQVLVKCASTDANFFIDQVELWDANKRILQKSGLKLWGNDKMHRLALKAQKPVMHGLCVSVRVNGNRVSADRIFEISGVGIDLFV
ncbi:DUF6623 family protein [Spongiivirga sp. MCCC 1A20706]|uniref:DUF6623 family protein n=1 Tax=Spongiivirga sp. MCCC 1A20706 TaxID=3160963 RepID=UPI0039773CD3